MVLEWRGRWTRERLSEWLRRAAAGGCLDDLAFGEVGGRLDFRGLCVGLEMGPLRVARLEGLELAGADFSGGHLELVVVERSTIRDCRFDGARIDELDTRASTWIDCSFRGARAAIGFDALWSGIDFTGADLRGSWTEGADFADCDFAGARFEGPVDLGASRLLRCRFAGRVGELVISRRPVAAGLRPGALHAVDFSEAVLEDVGLYGLDLSSCRLPDEADHVVVRGFVDFVEALCAVDVPFDLRLQLAAAAATLEPDQRVGLITLADAEGRFDAATCASIRAITAAWEAGAGA